MRAQSLFVCVCLSLTHTQTGSKHVQLSDILLSLHLLSSFCSLTPFLHMANKHTHKRNVIITVNIAVPCTYSVCRLPLPKKNKNARCYSHACSPIYLYCILVRTQILSLSLSFWLFLALVHFYLHNPATSMLFTDIRART